jgi:hypothetical protein
MTRKKKELPSDKLSDDAQLGHVHVESVKPTKLDAKFYAAVHKVKDGKSVPDDEWMIFLAKDDAVPKTLEFYHAECKRLGADEEHLASVLRMLRRVIQWRAANPDRCKVPDARGEKLLG